jgi:hypothetical protein
MPVGEKLRQFWSAEAKRVARQHELTHIGALNHATRFLSLLTWTLTEVEEATAAFLENIAEQEKYEAGHKGAAQKELFAEGGRLSAVVHFRVDTFYALGRLLLDRLAESPERYLGPAAGVRMSNHLELEANLRAFARMKGHHLPPTLAAKAAPLTQAFFSHRDLHVRVPGSRPHTASVWWGSGDAGMSPGDPYPGESVTLRELMDHLEEYVEAIVEYLDANRNAAASRR